MSRLRALWDTVLIGTWRVYSSALRRDEHCFVVFAAGDLRRERERREEKEERGGDGGGS
jgi:hypothetical protein